jgi:hypothetical protein
VRLTLALILLASTLAAAQVTDPAAIAQYEKPDREQFLLAGAKKEGEVTVYTSLIQEDLIALSTAFEKKYGVKVKGWRASSEKVLQRAVTEARANRNEADVIETNGPELEALYREKVLQPLRSPHLKDLLPQAIRPHGHWVGTRINMFVQTYNTSLVKKEDVPKSYADLANPRWKGKLGIEAEDEDWFAMVVTGLGEEQGLRLFREIAKNGFSVRKGHTLLAGLVASGEIPLRAHHVQPWRGEDEAERRSRRVVRHPAGNRTRERPRASAQARASARRGALRGLRPVPRRPGDPREGRLRAGEHQARKPLRRSCRSSPWTPRWSSTRTTNGRSSTRKSSSGTRGERAACGRALRSAAFRFPRGARESR